MRMVRVLVGALLLITGIPALLAGVALGADLTVDLRAEVGAGWAGPVTLGLLGGGVLLMTSALALLLRPVRPREVVFVVEPDQVPVLAGRLGVTSLSGLGASTAWAGDREASPARQLVSVGAPLDGPRPAISPVPAGRPAPERRPATLADLLDPAGEEASGPARSRHGDVPRPPAAVDVSLVWPPAVPPETAPPPPPAGPVVAGPAGDVPPVKSAPEPAPRPGRAVRRKPPAHRLRPAAPVDPAL